MNLHLRSEVWPGQIPRSTNGGIRPMLADQRPFLTIHYTGGGLWADPGDTITELQQIQRIATANGKPWEYNWVVDNEGHVWEYAGMFQAAHSEGENSLSHGVLLLLGLADAKKLTGFEKPSEAMITAVRELRFSLVDKGKLSITHQMRKHKDMPGAATMCPGPMVEARWADFIAPWIPAPPVLPIPPLLEDDMALAVVVQCPTLNPPQAEMLVVIDGSGTTVLRFSSQADKDAIIGALVPAPKTAIVSTGQWAQFEQLVATT